MPKTHRLSTFVVLIGASLLSSGMVAAKQPVVTTPPDEPAWPVLLKQQWGLGVDHDLRNPMPDAGSPAGLFMRVNARQPVTLKPVIALGVETSTHAGWYTTGPKAGDLPADVQAAKKELWSYAYKQPRDEWASGNFTPVPVEDSRTTFDPGDKPFGLWISNDSFTDGGVYTQPALVAKVNERLRPQPYKAMIYPNMDGKTGKPVPNSYIIGWEYSTNDDFQDVVTVIENVVLAAADPPVPGVVAADAEVRKLADGFKFVEGPAWDFRGQALLFSDIPPKHVVCYDDGETSVANGDSGGSNGLMLDKQGRLIACEHAARRVSRRDKAGDAGEALATHYQGKRLNSPNDLWLDAAGGIYFTDPRYGPRDDLELDKEAVYYLNADGELTRIIDDLVRPNGIALSPDGKSLYVLDNGAHMLYRYPVTGPGRIGKGERIAFVTGPDGMSVDAEGRLYITCVGGVWVLDAAGKFLGMIPTPEQPANCTFGGPGYRTLYITARTSLYAVETLTRGWHVHLDGSPKVKTTP